MSTQKEFRAYLTQLKKKISVIDELEVNFK